MKKVPFVTLEKLQEITSQFPTPFHLYDEKGIRENAKAVKEAFAWNKGFKEYFAVKATPNPFLIRILQEYGCGCDCSSMTELMMSKALGCKEGDVMFSSNDTPDEEFKYANEIGGIINLDDITHIESVEKAVGYIPKVISCRYNPGGLFKISNDIMDNPGDAKYGMTTEQIFDAFRILKSKGAKEFGIHSFLASNTVTNEYYPMLAKVMFELVVREVPEYPLPAAHHPADWRDVCLSSSQSARHDPGIPFSVSSGNGQAVHSAVSEYPLYRPDSGSQEQ